MIGINVMVEGVLVGNEGLLASRFPFNTIVRTKPLVAPLDAKGVKRILVLLWHPMQIN
jgi:hypothetical protein